MPEVDLYAPVKQFLEDQGYAVKGEIGACDIVAVRGDEEPVVVELKERLNLALVLQGVDRLGISEAVYIAFRIGKGQSASWRSRSKEVKRLLRRLGLGLLTVSAADRVTPSWIRRPIARGRTLDAASACSRSSRSVSEIRRPAAHPRSSASRRTGRMRCGARASCRTRTSSR